MIVEGPRTQVGRAAPRRVRGVGDAAATPQLKMDGRVPFFPGLEGLRGVAVLAVLLFHGGFSWAVGGYLGVSTFFTLSGFLITLLLLVEVAGSRTISLRGFYRRRLRRLMPASLAAIGLAIVFTAAAGTSTQRHDLGGDVTASLFDVANWHFILQKVSYADLFAAPSPLLHFWSLAIEEQFYLVFPAIALVLLVRWRVSRNRFGAILLGLMAVSLGITLFGGYSHDRIYFGTETRAFELLAGGLLAVVVYRHRAVDAIERTRVGPAVSAAGVVAAIACVVMWVTVPQTTDWLYRGGLAAYAVLTCAVIAAAIHVRGPILRILSTAGFRRVGELSYALYAFHWPIFLWLDGTRTGLGIWPLFGLRMAVTFGLAVLSARWLEGPVRRQRVALSGPSQLAVAVGLAMVLLIGSWAVTSNAPPPLIDFAAAQATLDHLATAGPPTSAAARTAADHDRAADAVRFPVRVAPFGDSTGVMAGEGLVEMNGRQNLVTEVLGWAQLGCPLGRGGLVRWAPDDISGSISADCDDWPDHDAIALTASQPDIAMVLYGPWDVLDRKLPGDDRWRSFGDPVYDAYMRHEMLALVDVLSSKGALVVWLTSPPVRSVPDRVDRMNQLIEQLPSERPGKVVVLDLAGYLASTGRDAQLRPDKIHLSYPGAAQVARDWLIPNLARVWAAKSAPPVARTGRRPS